MSTESTDALPSLAELQETIGPGAAAGRSRRWWIIGGVLLAVVAAGMLAYTLKKSRSQVQYLSVPVTRGDLAVTVEATGTLEAVTNVEVGSEVSGRILRELVDVNDEVKKGQIMAEIDPESLRS
ncbi:MAG TPA: biotin/lipoyl-binding protein, partial [Geothrix sp.]